MSYLRGEGGYLIDDIYCVSTSGVQRRCFYLISNGDSVYNITEEKREVHDTCLRAAALRSAELHMDDNKKMLDHRDGTG